jgi:two-component system nitrogen regulation sensor histidine kinase NtrY
MPKPSRKLSYDQIIFCYALLAGLPGGVVALCFLWFGDSTPKVQWTLTLLVVGCWLGFAAAARARVIYPLHTMANLLAALREGDFSVRARWSGRNDALAEVTTEINTLSQTLQVQRLSALEATALLRTVMAEIDVAIFAFDHERKLRLANQAAQRLLAQPAEQLLGRAASEIGLADCLEGEPARLLTATFPSGSGRWGMRRSQFRENGRPHALLVIADLSRSLREEELHAWQRLVRVLGHELNNSLAPIKSIAGSLSSLLRRAPRAADWEDDMHRGLEIIEARSEGLARFMQAYARLARLPAPVLAPCDIATLVGRAAALERRLIVTLPAPVHAPAHMVKADAAQLEQVLINLVKNAVESVLEQRAAGYPESGVRVTWEKTDDLFEIVIEDDGHGIANTANLFVPFFTTKPEGTGIGLVLSRQIAENHGGSLTLHNRTGANGCIATLRLPA